MGTFGNMFGKIGKTKESHRKPDKPRKTNKNQKNQKTRKTKIFEVLSSRYLTDYLATWVYIFQFSSPSRQKPDGRTDFAGLIGYQAEKAETA